MNILLWIAQILLAGIFLFTGFSKLFAYGKLAAAIAARRQQPIGISRPQAALIALAELAGALGLLIPAPLSPNYCVVRLAAAGLALLMVCAGIYHLRRREEAAPAVSLFLLALFVIVGRWPR
jgi:uncharacterized membrane protein YphA (DoxX/SURF4 family)